MQNNHNDNNIQKFNPLLIESSAYSGPLDVLLQLIRAHKQDITTIKLSSICQDYLDYLQYRQDQDLTVDCEFIEVASTLILIKSKELLPNMPEDIQEGELSAEDELKDRLIAYSNIQKLAGMLKSQNILNRDLFSRNIPENDKSLKDDISIIDFLSAYQKIIKRKSYDTPYTFSQRPWEVEQTIERLKQLLLEKNIFSLQDLSDNKDRHELITNLMAVLELARTRFLSMHQRQNFAQIKCYNTKKPFSSMSNE